MKAIIIIVTNIITNDSKMSVVETFPFKSLNGIINGEENGTYIAIFCNKPSDEVVTAAKYPR